MGQKLHNIQRFVVIMSNLIHTKDKNFILFSLQLAMETGDEGDQSLVDNERLPPLRSTQEQASYHRQCSLLRKAVGIG